MMAPSRGPLDPQPDTRSVSNSTASTSSTTADRTRIHSRRLSGALERRLSNVVDVEEASRLLECSQIQRQIRFQHLVRRLVLAIQSTSRMDADREIATSHKFCTGVTRQTVLRPHVSAATSASSSDLFELQLNSPHARWPTFSQVKTTHTTACVHIS
jgi:hypothetical protein